LADLAGKTPPPHLSWPVWKLLWDRQPERRNETVPQKPLTLPELASVVGVEYRTLHTWLQRGLLRPSLRTSSGTGTPNLFLFEDVVVGQVLADLRRGGVEIEQLHRAAEALYEHAWALSRPSFLLINGRVDVVSDADQAAAALERDSFTLAYNTTRALRDVEEALAAKA
jgi:DNA-binding transcriptional MerR regulator